MSEHKLRRKDRLTDTECLNDALKVGQVFSYLERAYAEIDRLKAKSRRRKEQEKPNPLTEVVWGWGCEVKSIEVEGAEHAETLVKILADNGVTAWINGR
jgi:hypothetical protein